MRKLFFLLVLASGMLAAQTPNATNTQTIGKFLKLSKVPSGLETDNVLVRGTDGIVKYVPRSAFGGGSGGTQGLQQILQSGNESTIGLKIKTEEPVGDNFSTKIDNGSVDIKSIYDANIGIRSYLTSSGISFLKLQPGETYFNSLVNLAIEYNNDLSLVNGYLTIGNQTGTAATLTINPSEFNSCKFYFPPSNLEGIIRTLATTEDIKLKEYTVSTLPIGTKGDVAFVNDAASPSFLATVVGGGSNVVRVFFNGSNWIVQ
nr:hypothetical protein [uncultured Flavobacterium sp.]